MNRASLGFFGLLAFSIVCWLCLGFHAPMIERDLTDRVQARLFAQDFDTIIAKVSGRDVRLTGYAENEQIIRRTTQIVTQIYGVGSVTQEIRLSVSETKSSSTPIDQAETISPSAVKAQERRVYQLYLNYDGQALHLEGALPSEAVRLVLRQSTIDQLTPDHLFEKLDIRAGAPAQWEEAARALLEAIFTLGKGEALVEQGRWQLVATAKHADQRTKVNATLRKAMPSSYKGQSKIDLLLSEAGLDCQQALDDVLANHRILFLVDSAIIQPESKHILRRVAVVAGNCSNLLLRISGHSKARDDQNRSQILSQARAEMVRNYLIEAGIQPSRLSAIGYGSLYPITNDEASSAPTGNHRVEINVLEDTL